MEKEDLDSIIKGLELKLEKDKGNDIILYQLQGLYELKEKKKKDKEKNGKITRAKLEEEKKMLYEKKEELKKNGGNIEEYLKIEKSIKKLNTNIRELRNEMHYLNELEFKRLKSCIRKNKNNGDKYLLIILLAYEGALRVSELIDLKISDISFIENTMLCRRLKGSNETIITLSDKTVELLEKFVKKYKIKEGLIFRNREGKKYTPISINKMFQLYCGKAKITRNKQRFHTLKHTRAAHLGAKGVTLQQIQHMLGHKSINSTMVYVQFTKNMEDDIYQKIGGYGKNK